MVEEGSLEFRLREINDTRNFLLDEIKHNDLMCEKYKKTCNYLNYVEHFLIVASTFTGCISISPFASLICVAFGITTFGVGTKICAMTAGIKKYKEKEEIYDKIVNKNSMIK